VQVEKLDQPGRVKEHW